MHVMAKLNFQCHMIIQKSADVELFCFLSVISVKNICAAKCFYGNHDAKEKHLLKIPFFDHVKVFIITFDQFNVSLLNKSNFFKKKKIFLSDTEVFV